MSTIKIANAITKRLFRSALTDCLNQIEDFVVFEEDIDNLEKFHHIDIVIFDDNIFDLLNVKHIANWKKLNAHLQIMLIFNEENMVYLQQVIKHGVSGFIHSNCSVAELETSIRTLHKNHRYIAPEISNHLLFDNQQTGFLSLTSREMQILKMVTMDGMALVQIAKTLQLSPKTITAHKANIMTKLSCKNNVDLIHQARTYFKSFGSNQ